MVVLVTIFSAFMCALGTIMIIRMVLFPHPLDNPNPSGYVFLTILFGLVVLALWGKFWKTIKGRPPKDRRR